MSRLPFVVLDDDDLAARAFARVLGRLRKTLIAHSIDEFNVIERRERGLCGMLIDEQLPDGRGIDVATRLRGSPGFLPLAIVAGQHRADVCTRAFRLHVQYLCKPVEKPELISFATFALEYERSRDQRSAERIAARAASWEFSPPEMETTVLALRGLRGDAIARARGVGENGHKTAVRSMLRKSGTRSIEALVTKLLDESASGLGESDPSSES